jgi:hypothetical protein
LASNIPPTSTTSLKKLPEQIRKPYGYRRFEILNDWFEYRYQHGHTL